MCKYDELDGSAVSILNVRLQKLSNVRAKVIGWVTPCFGRAVKPVVPTAFVVVSSYQSSLGLHFGLWHVLLMCNLSGRPLLQQWGH
jgi:hypothetical protein